MDLDAQSAPPPSPFLPLHQATIISKVLVDRKGALIAVHVTIEDQVNTNICKANAPYPSGASHLLRNERCCLGQ